ncbi:MAG TPA: HAD family hydrolase, partial [Candidatus Polarisedimenticolia bacterium]|nr:HAD family hydrolase [Candidatus Polarisedimenticolia bacterium]
AACGPAAPGGAAGAASPETPRRISAIAAALQCPRMDPATGLRGICFDLWNTLAWTDHRPHPLAALAAAYGLDSEPDWRRILERLLMTRRLTGISDALDRLSDFTGRPPAGRTARRDLVLLWGEAVNATRIFPDAIPTLRALRRASAGYRLGLVSNTQSFDLDFLRRSGLEKQFDAVVLSCDCGLLKPDPAIFRLAAGRLGLQPGQLVMVGDRYPDDVEGARAAGMRAILLDRAGRASTGSGNRSAAVVASLLELPDRVADPVIPASSS